MIIRVEHTLDKEEYQAQGLSKTEINEILATEIGLKLLKEFPPVVTTHDDGEENYAFTVVAYRKATTQVVRTLLESNLNESNRELHEQIIKLLFYETK